MGWHEINAYKILVSEVKRKGSRECLEPRWHGNIKIYLNKIERENVDWIHPAQNRDK
jgi:hypothetical protein